MNHQAIRTFHFTNLFYSIWNPYTIPISGRGDEIPQHFDVVDESDGDDGIVGGESENGEESEEVIDDEVAP